MALPTVRGRPLVARRFLGAWLVLVATLPGGLRSYFIRDRVGLTAWNPGEKMGVNFRTYHHAAELALDGARFYDTIPPGAPGFAEYLYPPGTVPLFYPFALVEWPTGYAILTGLSVVAAVVTTGLIVDYVESRGPQLGWLDVALILLSLVLSTHVFGTIFFGNINLLLALGIVVGLWALERDREMVSGVAFGAVALFKLFPALVGLWLLRRRRLRAVGGAVATGVGGLVAGVLAFGPDTTEYYLTEVVSGRTDTAAFVGGYPVDEAYYLTIQQPVSWLVSAVWPAAPYAVIFAGSVAIVAAVLAYFYRHIETPIERQMAIFVTLAGMVTVIPSLRWYIVFLYLPVITLLYTWSGGRGRRLFLAGGVLLSVTVSAEAVVEALAGLPGPLSDLGYALGGSAVIPLYGIGLMVLGCALHKRSLPSTGHESR